MGSALGGGLSGGLGNREDHQTGTEGEYAAEHLPLNVNVSVVASSLTESAHFLDCVWCDVSHGTKKGKEQ
jgi:hypothetical protein